MLFTKISLSDSLTATSQRLLTRFFLDLHAKQGHKRATGVNDHPQIAQAATAVAGAERKGTNEETTLCF
jgi:hypothetical protein